MIKMTIFLSLLLIGVPVLSKVFQITMRKLKVPAELQNGIYAFILVPFLWLTTALLPFFTPELSDIPKNGISDKDLCEFAILYWKILVIFLSVIFLFSGSHNISRYISRKNMKKDN